jgi:effector-binding domain-containing protein
MKKALIIIVGIILVIAAMGVFFIEKMMLVDTSQYEYLSQPRITEMQNQKVIEIELTGNPSETAPKAMGELFPVFYALKGSGNTISKPVPKTRWIGDFNNMQTLVGKYAMQVSDNVTQLPDLKGSQVKLVTWKYGTVAEVLHVGAYDQEGQTVTKLMKYINDNGYKVIGEHEEEYLQGPDLLRLIKPKDYKTIIRYRIKKI